MRVALQGAGTAIVVGHSPELSGNGIKKVVAGADVEGADAAHLDRRIWRRIAGCDWKYGDVAESAQIHDRRPARAPNDAIRDRRDRRALPSAAMSMDRKSNTTGA
jgi:hypothetical protein